MEFLFFQATAMEGSADQNKMFPTAVVQEDIIIYGCGRGIDIGWA